MTDNVCFVDCETTGLDPDKHAIWEVALITPNRNEYVWQFPIDEMAADPFALDIGRYWDRSWDSDIPEITSWDAVYNAHSRRSRRKNFPDRGRAIKPTAEWCRFFQTLTAGCHLAGAVVSFDEERLRRLLHTHGVLHRWHYHLIDVEALAIGFLQGQAQGYRNCGQGHMINADPLVTPPWKSDELTAALGITVAETDRHTALGDARLARAVYEAVMATPTIGVTDGEAT